uniref:Uncharacterized protein n=1 Tax=Pseudomonas aeruginosa TaxID=287 RepID=A0A7S6G5M0_PSEAI|nr:hypothetical protein [Pseudomonas aeruginosa]QNI17368.1 hypothetical protein [Pseudomonas aeruginosa]
MLLSAAGASECFGTVFIGDDDALFTVQWPTTKRANGQGREEVST